jgi:hypothetical protein
VESGIDGDLVVVVVLPPKSYLELAFLVLEATPHRNANVEFGFWSIPCELRPPIVVERKCVEHMIVDPLDKALEYVLFEILG